MYATIDQQRTRENVRGTKSKVTSHCFYFIYLLYGTKNVLILRVKAPFIENIELHLLFTLYCTPLITAHECEPELHIVYSELKTGKILRSMSLHKVMILYLLLICFQMFLSGYCEMRHQQ